MLFEKHTLFLSYFTSYIQYSQKERSKTSTTTTSDLIEDHLPTTLVLTKHL